VQLSDFERFPNLVAMFLDRARERGERPFLSAKHDHTWTALSWREVADQVCLLAQGLRGLGRSPSQPTPPTPSAITSTSSRTRARER
jgi:long-chain acyl-CoA synthetase